MLTRIVNPEIALLGGVLAGFSYRFGIPTWIVRSVFVVLLLITFMLPLVVYLVLWSILPTQQLTIQEFNLGVQKGFNNDSVDITKR